jgi:hypothetical protein
MCWACKFNFLFFFFLLVMKVEDRWIRLRHLQSKPCGIKLIKTSLEAGSLIWSEEEQYLRTPEAAGTGD